MYAVTLALFLISGFASLTYQVVWTRLLIFVFGSTTFATATVLCVFMGGLALGSYLAGMISDRITRPFLWYGILEGLIGLYAIAAPMLIDASLPLYKLIWLHFHLFMLPFSLLRFIIVGVILLVPTTCMGATLPLLARYVVTNISQVGERVGNLYAANTVGAGCGAILAGFILIPSLGLTTTTYIASLTNIALCLVSLWIAFKGKMPFDQSPIGVASTPVKLQTRTKFILTMFAFSGAVAMSYEVAWTRALLMVIGSSTYAFTIMLSTFLFGIFLGSAVMSKLVGRLREPLYFLVAGEFAIGLCGLISIFLFGMTPYWNIVINARFPANADAALIIRFLLAATIILPTTILFGAIFPLVTKVCTTDLERVGNVVAKLYSANTIGCIFGAFLCGFVVIPLLGTEQTLLLASIANWLIATAIFLFLNRVGSLFKVLAIVVCGFSIVWATGRPQIWDRLLLTVGQQERRFIEVDNVRTMSYDSWSKSVHNKYSLRFWKDGVSETVAVLTLHQDNQEYTLLFTNGHCDGSIGESDDWDVVNEVLTSGLPLLFKPSSENVAVIGWGTGISTGIASLLAPHVTAVEIEPTVVETSQFFSSMNLSPEKNPRVQIYLNDGRNYLLATDTKFDVIVSEPSNPWRAGVCNLFTQEYFAICKSKLNDSGIFSAWMNIYEVSLDNILKIGAAACAVYHYVLPVLSSNGDVQFICSDTLPKIEYKKANNLIALTANKAPFLAAGISSVDDVLARIVTDPLALAQWVRGVKPNSDDHNLFEYDVAKNYESKVFWSENTSYLDGLCREPWQVVDWGDMTNHDIALAINRVAGICLKLHYPIRALTWSQHSYELEKNSDTLTMQALCKAALRKR